MKVVMNIPGIKCEGCVATIEEALSRVEGIGRYKINLDSKTLIVDPGTMDVDKIKEVLSDLGYPPL